MSGSRDEWTCGYAAGLAAAWRTDRSGSMVKLALVGDGLTLDKLRAAGVEAFDLDALTEAIGNDSSPAGMKAKGQCQDVFTSTRGRTVTHTYCLKRADHDGDHRGERCQWNKAGERVKITEPHPRQEKRR